MSEIKIKIVEAPATPYLSELPADASLIDRAESLRMEEEELSRTLLLNYKEGWDNHIYFELKTIATEVQKANVDFHRTKRKEGSPTTKRGRKGIAERAREKAWDELGTRLRELDQKGFGLFLASLYFKAARGEEEAITEILSLCPLILDNSEDVAPPLFDEIRNHFLKRIMWEAEKFRRGLEFADLNKLITGSGKTKTVKVPKTYLRYARNLFHGLLKMNQKEANRLARIDQGRYGGKPRPADRAAYLTCKTFKDFNVSLHHIERGLALRPAGWPWNRPKKP